MQVWIKYPQFHWIGVQATHKLMQEHVSKRAKMQKAKKAKRVAQGKHINIARSGEKGVFVNTTDGVATQLYGLGTMNIVSF